MDTPEINQSVIRPRKITVLAYGEGEDEKIFLRHLVKSYCRSNKVTVQTGSAGGGAPMSILHAALRARRGEKRNHEFILLDTDKPWPEEMINLAQTEGIELIGNEPCLEAFFLEIINSTESKAEIGTGKYKESFEELCTEKNFNEEECVKIFPKSLLNSARLLNSKLDKIIKIFEGEV
jgi:hypothetical protein